MADKNKGFSVKVDGGGTTIELDRKVVTSVNFSIVTGADYVKQHNNDVYVLITVKGIISSGIAGVGNSKDETRKLAMWSLDDENEKIYRKIVVECYPGGDLVRRYTLDKAFCIDYRETFDVLEKKDSSADGKSSSDNAGNDGVFELKVAQLKSSIETVEINS